IPFHMLVVLPSFKTFHATCIQPGSKLVTSALYHLLATEFLKFLNCSLEEEFPILITVTAILHISGTVFFSSPSLRIFTQWHTTALTELTLSHNLSLGCSDEFLSHSEE